MLQIPAVQTGLAQYAGKKLASSLDGLLTIESIQVHPFNALTIKNAVILDTNPYTDDPYGLGVTDTLARIERLSATLSLKGLFNRRGLLLNRVEAEGLLFQLAIEPDDKYGNNLIRIFKLIDDGSEMSMDSIFTVKHLKVKDARFRMLNHCYYLGYDAGMDYGDLDVSFDVDGQDISFSEGRMRAKVNSLQAREKSGYHILDASGSCCVGMGKTILKDINLRDACGSDINLPDAVLSYSCTDDWADYVNKVDMDIRFAPSRLVFESISYYSGGTFKDCKLTTDIQKGRFKGTVSDFAVESVDFTTPYGPSGNADYTMRGLPEVSETYLSAKLNDIQFTGAGLQAALAEVGADIPISNFAPGTVFTLNGEGSGPMRDLKANASLSSAIGGLNMKVLMRNLLQDKKNIELNVDLGSERLHLGKLLGSEQLGESAFSASADGTLGSDMALNVSKLEISRLGFLGYEYSGLSLDGRLKDKTIAARLLSNDPNALLNLEGSFDLNDKSAQLSADLQEINLAALNIDKRGGTSKIACTINGEQGIHKKAPLHVMINDLLLRNDNGLYRIGDIEAEARLQGEDLTALINSGFMDAKYNGPSNFNGLVKFLKSASIEREMPSFFISGATADSKAYNATLSAVFHDTEDILAFVMPQVGIAAGTALNIDIAEDGTLLGYINSPLLKYGGIRASDIKLALDNADSNLSCLVNADLLKVNDMSFEEATLHVETDDNLTSVRVGYEGSDLLNKGSELNLQAFLMRDEAGRPAVSASTLPSILRIKENIWELQESFITMNGGELEISGFNLASETQSLTIDGCMSPFRRDTLQVSLSNLNLDLVNEFLSESTPKIEGVIDGYMGILSPVPKEFSLGADLTLKEMAVDGIQAGDFKLKSTLADDGNRVRLKLDNDKDGKHILGVAGTYGIKDSSIDATVNMDRFGLGIGAPFLRDYISELGGDASGVVQLSGTTDKLQLKSDGIKLDQARARVRYTNVAYILNGTMGLDEGGLKFNDINVTDDFGGSGTLSGGLAFKYLKNFRMDTRLRMRQLKAINIPDEDSPILVYGDLALSGFGRISGPFNALHVDADVATDGTGNVSLPLPSSATAQGNDLLTFTAEPSLNEDEVLSASRVLPAPSAKFTAHAVVSVSPDVTASIEIDKESGHALSAEGNGQLIVDLNTSNASFQINGDYNIEKGKYLFNIPGIVSKEFDIKSGSKLKLNGDIMESALDLKAVHTVKTSLATLVTADSTSVSSRRPVECGINIGGKLQNPEVEFSINVPDLEPNTKMYVESALSTKDKVQKQFVALLLFGTFLPEEGSGVVNGTNMIASNVGEIVSSQLNNILQKLDIPLDFGLGYQQDNVGTDIFDVAVSTQLFNNRVLVNGSVGNRKFSTSKSSYGDFVGDIDIEVKIDRSGELRFKVFSHSADEFSSSLDFSQRNGLGLSYQKEFDRTKDFFRQLFMSRQQKNNEALTEASRNRKMKTIQVK